LAPASVTLGDCGEIPSGMIVWATGVRAPRLADSLGLPQAPDGRIDAGVVQSGRIRFSGRLAFFAWGTLHSLHVPGWRNRLGVNLNWIWSYATHRRAGLLLIGAPSAPAEWRVQAIPEHAQKRRRQSRVSSSPRSSQSER
jgi:NADH dehydrogenase FAD-containing subunit